MAYFIALFKGIVATLSNVWYFLPDWLASHRMPSLARGVQTAQLILLLALVLWVLSAMAGNPVSFYH
jgi:hypothetical protein